jgi:hypothetical protein
MGFKSNANLVENYMNQKAKVPFYSDTEYKNTFKAH